MSAKADVSILGCGWLGLPLAEALVKSGKSVKGSTTSPAKLNIMAQKGIAPYLVNLQPELLDEAILADFLEADCLVINIPPRLRSDKGDAYLEQLHLLVKALLDAPVKKIIIRLLHISLQRSKPSCDRRRYSAYKRIGPRLYVGAGRKSV